MVMNDRTEASEGGGFRCYYVSRQPCQWAAAELPAPHAVTADNVETFPTVVGVG